VFGALYAAERTPPGALADVAREFSPRIDIGAQRDRAFDCAQARAFDCAQARAFDGAQARAFDGAQARDVTLDLSGLERLFGDARAIAAELRRTAADRGLRVRVAIAGTRTAARLLARHRPGLTVIEPGTEAQALASLPIDVLGEIEPVNFQLPNPNAQEPASHSPQRSKLGVGSWQLGVVFRQWGLRTLGDLAALPSNDLAARLGANGVAWQRLARGEDPHPLVPSLPEERFEQALDLEWPIEELEPLSFVLGRLMEPLSAHLERRDRGAAVLHVRLHLVRVDDTTPEVHARSLQLPAPMRDARTLRTLALLDLESNPPPAPIDRVEVAVDPTPGRIVQYSLLTRALPTPERLSTLMARLQALTGETRCGSPALVDSWKPGAFEMRPFAPVDANVVHRKHDTPRHRATEAQKSSFEKSDLGASVPRCVVSSVNDASEQPLLALRRFRHPIPARVRVRDAQPEYVAIDRRGLSGGGVESCAGPWRTAGDWWREGWDRDEWDVTVAGGTTYRLFRARDTDRWFVDGVVD
jgi:protein ImuB